VDSDFLNRGRGIGFEVTATRLCFFFKAALLADSDRAGKGKRKTRLNLCSPLFLYKLRQFSIYFWPFPLRPCKGWGEEFLLRWNTLIELGNEWWSYKSMHCARYYWVLMNIMWSLT